MCPALMLLLLFFLMHVTNATPSFLRTIAINSNGLADVAKIAAI